MADVPHDDGEDKSLRPFSSFLRARLAWNTSEAPPTFEELGLKQAGDAAIAWQDNRNWAEWFGFAWHDEGTRGWVREIHGLFGSAGELVLSSIEAAVEVAITQRAMASPDGGVDEQVRRVNRAAQWRAIRFFAEAQANNLVVFGHTAANLVIRTLALQPGFSVEEIAGLDPRIFLPGSDRPKAWASLTRGIQRELRRSAAGLPIDSRELIASLAALRVVLAPVTALRGVQYHRWRGESPGVTGINFSADTNEHVENGIVTRTLRLHTEYIEGEKIVDDLVTSADEALKSVGEWMPGFLDVWVGAFNSSKALHEEAARRLWQS